MEHGPREPDPVAELTRSLYDALRETARRVVARSRAPIEPTEVVHEAFVRLARAEGYRQMTRNDFLALAATVMRRLLVDQARERDADRRGAGWRRVTMSGLPGELEGDGVDVLDLDDALARLAAIDERQARIVELRFFGGLTGEEVAELLGLSRRMVTREWTMARAWLRRELER